MCRLSIITLFSGDVASFESTLASILRHRPDDCEVFVAQTATYEDQHGIDDEACFLDSLTEPVAALNDALEHCRGEIAHILLPGAEVAEGWTKAAMSRFDDPQIGSAACLIKSESDATLGVSLGLSYSASGHRLETGKGAKTRKLRTQRVSKAIGPTLNGAFYRMTAIEDIGGFEPEIGAGYCDVDAALLLHEAGYKTAIEPSSEITASASTFIVSAYDDGLQNERLFRRHAGEEGATPLSRKIANSVDSVAGLFSGGLSRLFGRRAANREAIIEKPEVTNYSQTGESPDVLAFPGRTQETSRSASQSRESQYRRAA